MKRFGILKTRPNKKSSKYNKMKRKPYKEPIYEEDEYYEEDEVEYYEDEDTEYEDDDEEYYEEEAEYEDDEVEYEDEADDEEYYEEAEYEDDEVEYEDEADDEEYYEEAEYEDEADDEEYYEEAEYEDEVDDEEYYEEEKAKKQASAKKTKKQRLKEKRERQKSHAKGRRGKKAGIAAAFERFMKYMTPVDAILAGTGIVLLIIAIVTVNIWNNTKVRTAQVSAMAEVGKQLSEVSVIGQSGLLAVADAKSNGMPEELTEEPTAEEQSSEEVEEDIEITVNMTSVERDLKVKFVNKKTKKLISGTEFKMEQTGPDGKTKTLTDEDKDGIIYQKNLTAGTYSIKLLSVDGFTFPDSASKVTVKDKIEYKKIDIADEVKTEKEVNAAKEDTQQNIVEESKLKDTVEFVESSKTPIGGGNSGTYEEVKKSDIADPGASASARNVVTQSVDGYFFRATGSGEGEPQTSSEQPSSEQPSSEQQSSSEQPSSSEQQSSSSEPVTPPAGGNTQVKVEAITLDKSTLSVQTGASAQITVTKISPDNATDKSIHWSSGDSSIATVDSSGKVTGVKAGETTVMASAGDAKVSCKVTVTAAAKPVTGVTLDKTTASVNTGATVKLTATVAPNDASNKNVTWASSDTAIATVGADGTVKGIKEGKANVTVTTEDGKHTATCAVTVAKSALSLTLSHTEVSLYKGADITLTMTPVNFSATPEYTFISGDEKIAKINSKGKITAIAKGTTTVKVVAKKGSEEASATCKVLVKLKVEDDKQTKLKDKAGNQMFVKENGSYREAFYADYYLFDKFYKSTATNYKYTGWQTIDNVTYYFDKDGNKVTGTQVIKGVQYTFDSNGALSLGSGTLGIDVSKWNGTINWAAVKNSGVSFAIIRCGYRGSSTGALIQDPKFAANIKGAQAAGIKVGVYFFTQAVNEVEAVEEASMVLNMVSGYGLQMPIYIDTEGSGGRADGIDKNTRTAVCKAFCATIQNAGKSAGVYASKSWFETKLNAGSLSGYKIWLAQYSTKPTYGGRYDMWQYTSKGRIGGINGNVDLNILY